MISMLYNSKYSTFFSNTGLVLSYDAGWQIRGRGRNYNSLSGIVYCEFYKIIMMNDFFLCVNEYEIKLQYVVGKFFFIFAKPQNVIMLYEINQFSL